MSRFFLFSNLTYKITSKIPWIPLSKAAIKYDIHPLTLLGWIEKDDICGATIGNNWFIDEATLQEFIGEHFPMSPSDRKTLHRNIQNLKKQIKEEIQKGKQPLQLHNKH